MYILIDGNQAIVSEDRKKIVSYIEEDEAYWDELASDGEYFIENSQDYREMISEEDEIEYRRAAAEEKRNPTRLFSTDLRTKIYQIPNEKVKELREKYRENFCYLR